MYTGESLIVVSTYLLVYLSTCIRLFEYDYIHYELIQNTTSQLGGSAETNFALARTFIQPVVDVASRSRASVWTARLRIVGTAGAQSDSTLARDRARAIKTSRER